MVVVKKTVAIHPILDGYIRKTWSILIEKGHDATYSTALNYMLLTEVLYLAGFSENEISESIQSFLDDEKSLRDLNLEDYANKADELFRQKDKDQNLT